MARRAVFLDLHGTLGDVKGDVLGDFPDFAWYDCAQPAIRALHDADILAIALTNQARIGAGRFTMAAFEKRSAELQDELGGRGARLDAVYCCPHGPEDGCPCRKPARALADRAAGDFNIDLDTSFVVGDTGATDVLLARAIGATAVLVRTGWGEGSLGEYRHTWAETEADYVAADVLDAVGWILRQRLG